MGEKGEECSGGRLHLLKLNTCTGIIPRQKSDLTRNRHLTMKDKNEKQVVIRGG
jgi:hypothetical protein